jgi:hypothetical protein
LAWFVGCTVWAAQGVDAGRAIYLEGQLASGAPLQASRDGGTTLVGKDAACVNCHRRSGYGGQEGRSTIPPITGLYLFHPRNLEAEHDLPYVAGMRGERDPYTDSTLARALREGLDAQGRALSFLMPHFALGDADMAALIGYLRQLDKSRVPGVDDGTLHLATIITPDAEPRKRQGMLAVLNQFFADRNIRQPKMPAHMFTSGKTAYSKSMFRSHQQWQLHVWELSGPPSGWQKQLEKFLAREPVFAVISGLGGKTWEPVNAFCEAAALPCLFPNVDLPVDRAGSHYGLYFSKGVVLEAELIANRLLDGTAPLRNVLQVYRAGDVGEAAAQSLAMQLKQLDVHISSTVLAADAPAEAVAATLEHAAPGDVQILWLRPADIAALPLSPSGDAVVYMSGLMGELENTPLPPAWRGQTHMTYPFDLPDARRVRVDFALGWFNLRKIAVTALQVQADTYLACGLLSETLNHMADNLVRDYLLERMQDLLEHRVVTGYYPRLALANGQYFASKGGYIVHFADASGRRVIAEQGWTVP